MALARIRRSESGMNYWPGFVDALSTLILGIIFLLTVFVVVQFYLQQEVAGKDTALNRLNAQIAQLTELLGLEKSGKAGLEDQLTQLRATLAVAESERDRLRSAADSAGAGAAAAQGKATELAGQLEGRKNSRPGRSPKSRCSTSRLRPCAVSSPPLSRHWMRPKRRTRNLRPASPSLASGLIWPWPSALTN